jgi:hypothetical protein
MTIISIFIMHPCVDSYHFFAEWNKRRGAAVDAADGRGHLVTGPTGTNVMDVAIIIVRRRTVN